MTMKTKILASTLLLGALLASQMSLTAHAAEDDIILISPNPAAEKTTAADTDALLQGQYEAYAGMYSYDGIADQLYSIKVLLGDGVNFNLDQIPDRQQACVMVVRMRGEEAAALAAYEAGEITCPFTDITDEWVKPYLAWLYDKEIVLGTGEGKFGNSTCTPEMYITFMLRALGYNVTWDAASDTDVLYADALNFARGINLWDSRLALEPEFNRGVMSAVTYQTLAADVKGTYQRLLSALVGAGAIDADAAQPILDLYDAVDTAAAMELAAVPMMSAMKLAGEMTQEEYYVMSVTGAPEGDPVDEISSTLAFDFALDFTDGRQEYALDGGITMQVSGMDMTVPMGMWLHDGWMYADMMEQKVKTPVTEETALEGLTDLPALFSDTGYQYYTVSEVLIEELDGTDPSGLTGTLITYDATDFMWPIIAAQIDDETFTADAALSALVSTEKFIGADGVLAGVYNGMYAILTETDGTGVTRSAEMLSQTGINYTAWGDDVVLTFPDFSQFVEETAAE